MTDHSVDLELSRCHPADIMTSVSARAENVPGRSQWVGVANITELPKLL